MRFLIDNNLAVSLTKLLKTGDHDVVHVRSLGLAPASDEVILRLARETDRVLISADTDFGTILARTQATSPSFLLIRRLANRRAEEQAALILGNIEAVADDLAAGAVVVLGERTIRIRRLPIK